MHLLSFILCVIFVKSILSNFPLRLNFPLILSLHFLNFTILPYFFFLLFLTLFPSHCTFHRCTVSSPSFLSSLYHSPFFLFLFFQFFFFPRSSRYAFVFTSSINIHTLPIHTRVFFFFLFFLPFPSSIFFYIHSRPYTECWTFFPVFFICFSIFHISRSFTFRLLFFLVNVPSYQKPSFYIYSRP